MTPAIEVEAGNSCRAIHSRRSASARDSQRGSRDGPRRDAPELPGIGAPEAATIVRFRSEHGPITDAAALARVLGNRPLADEVGARADFAPADSTAPEAPGA